MECVRQWPSLKLGCLGTNRMPRGSKLLEMPPDCLALADSGKSSCTSRLLTPCLNVTGRVYNALRAASHRCTFLHASTFLSQLRAKRRGSLLISRTRHMRCCIAMHRIPFLCLFLLGDRRASSGCSRGKWIYLPSFLQDLAFCNFWQFFRRCRILLGNEHSDSYLVQIW